MTPNFKKSALIFSAIFAFTFVSLACENEIVEQVQDDDVIFMVVEKMPEFPGGMEALFSFIGEKTRRPFTGYHVNWITGRATVQFVVEVDGSITDIRVVHSVTGFEAEAVKVIESMPNWIPGEQNGKKVRVMFTLPITFRLQ